MRLYLFQSTRPHGARRFREEKIAALFYFNPRALTGRDDAPHRAGTILAISIHAPSRGATVSVRPYILYGDISIHAPSRGATLTIRDMMALEQISIHAPSRGATRINTHIVPTLPISIHAPSRGATARIRDALVLGQHFNPRALTGRDPCRCAI